jgi:hypothetical protein
MPKNKMKFYSIDEDIRYTLSEILSEAAAMAKAGGDHDAVMLYSFLLEELESAKVIGETDTMPDREETERLKKAERYFRLMNKEQGKRYKQKKKSSLHDLFNDYYNRREISKKTKGSKPMAVVLKSLGLLYGPGSPRSGRKK